MPEADWASRATTNGGLRARAEQLLASVARVTPEEFRWQESHYEHDSRHGRELLFLIANHEWVRATSEIVDVTRSDAVDTTIKIDIDLDQIIHEAFRNTERLWLPVIVLPPHSAKQAPDQPRLEPDPFATVTDAAGRSLAMLPNVDVRHQISAAMAEIIVNMAVARWPGRDEERPTATRDMRLVSSAAIYRLLRRGPVRSPAGDGIHNSPVAASPPLPRIANAKGQVRTLFASYERLLHAPSETPGRTEADSTTSLNGSKTSKSAEHEQGSPQFAPELVRRAVMVLEAFAVSEVVVVPIDRESTPTVLTVRVPTRRLDGSRTWKLDWKSEQSRTWKLRRPSTWILRPLAHLQIDVLLPSADADRQVQINLPDGVFFEPDGVSSTAPRAGRVRHHRLHWRHLYRPSGAKAERQAQAKASALPSMVIEVEPPQPLEDLAVLIGELDSRQHTWPVSLLQCLADLAKAKAGAAREILREHQVGAASDRKNVAAGGSQAVTADARANLAVLSAQLDQLLTGPSVQAVTRANADRASDASGGSQAATADARAKWGELREELDQRLVLSAKWAVLSAQLDQLLPRPSVQAVTVTKPDQTSDPASSSLATAADVRAKWVALRPELDKVLIKVTLTELREVSGTLRRERLYHRTSAGSSSPRTAVARADMIEDVSQRGAPKRAQVHADVAVTDAEYFSIARFSGAMSLLLMTVVLVFFLVARRYNVLNDKNGTSAEVLAIVLTLFSAIQAGRIARPDRSTLRGVLSPVGNWLIVASILPAVILAVALAFTRSGWFPVYAAVGCILLQLFFQLAMWRGPLTSPTATGSTRPAKRRLFFTEAADYHYSEALRSDWWRSTTADALRIGLKAYAYVVWQEGPSPKLPQLLKGATTVDGPANVLALLHSGTVGQAVTFVVFREEPTDWAARVHACELDLDPDRLAPSESVTSTVDVFLGVDAHDRLKMKDHPLTSVLGAAAHRLIVLEAQLPVPAPVAGYPSRHWARVRVALRDDKDIKRLAPFLDAIESAAAKTGHQHWVVAVQAVVGGVRRIITQPITELTVSARKTGPEPAASPTQEPLVLASEMDVVNAAANGEERADARTWRVLAICADGRSNIENDIVQKLGDVRRELQLVGLTYALLHGTAVILMLGHDSEGHIGQGSRGAARGAPLARILRGFKIGPGRENDDLQIKLRSEPKSKERVYPALPRLRVLVNEWRSQNQLGRAEDYPLLQVHFRSQDRPGALLNVLASLNKTLNDELPSVKPDDWRVWHAQTQVTAGQAALTRLTVRLHTEHGSVETWGPVNYEEIERKVRTLAVGGVAAASSSSNPIENANAPEDPVISVSLIRAPARTS
jgi:hypothetical protein